MTDFSLSGPANVACIAKARPGEPAFILLGRDPDAGTIVREWAARRAHACNADGMSIVHALEAQDVADAMDAYVQVEGNAADSAPHRALYPLTPGEQMEALRDAADQLLLAKLVARFFRVMILGGLVIPETPAAMDWLRDYIDGTHKVHGPLGKPMIWPDRLTSVTNLLRSWGFQPTPTNPPYVAMKPGGVMADIVLVPGMVDAPAPLDATPAEDGWWWCRNRKGAPATGTGWHIAQVVIQVGGPCVYVPGSDMPYMLAGFEWGPRIVRPVTLTEEG